MKRAMKLALFVVSVLMLYFGTSNAWTQEVRATIGGRVTDPQGAVVPSAIVTVISDQTGVERQTQTNSQGNWIVQFLLPGPYHFLVAASGFKNAERKGITLQASDNKEIDTQLEVGTSTQSVIVTGEAPLIDTTSGTSGTVITAEQISELPSSTHVSTLLAGLSPGVLLQDQTPGNTHMWSNIGASAILADGGRGNRSNSIILDGMPDTKSNGDISFIPPSESVEEFRVQTNAYDASIGRQAGATINMQTKSGSKDYHGSLYEYNQNNFLNAYFIQTKVVKGAINPVHFNEYGGTFGGPVWIPKIYNGKKKTFFFVSFDDTHNIDPRGGGLRSVPTESERKGDFSQSYTTQASTGKRLPVQVYNPFVLFASSDAGTTSPPRNQDAGTFRAKFRCDNNGLGNPITPDATGFQAGGAPCVGPDPSNPAGPLVYRPKVPSQLLSPIAQNILKFVPLGNIPNDPGGNSLNNFRSTATRTDTFPVVSIRVDQNWSNSHHSFLSVRWNHLHEFLDDHFGNAATGNFQERVSHGLGLDHVWTLSGSKVLDLRFSVNRFRQPNINKGAGFDPTQLGLPASFVSQLNLPSFPRIVGFAGDFGTDQAGTYQASTFYTWSGSLTQVRGNHTMRYGSEYWIMQEGNFNIGNQGQFEFNNSNWVREKINDGGCPGSCSNFGSFLLGLPAGGNVPVNFKGSPFYSQRFLGFYFQDDWRVTTKLTLNLGLRWDYERPVVERYNRLTSNFDPNALNPISPAVQARYATIQGSTNPTQTCADAGVSSGNRPQCVDALNRLKLLVPPSQFKIPGVQLFAGVGSQPRTFSDADLHEWQPRFGVAYRITPNTVIRGGVGRFTQATFERGGQNGFSRSTPFVASNNGFRTPADTLANPFQSGVLQPTGSALGPLTNLGQGVSWDNQNPNRPYSWEYSVHLQHQLKKWLFEVGYSHNKTYGIYWGRVMDDPPFSVWQDLRAPRDSSGNPLEPNSKPSDTLLWDTPVPNPFRGVTVAGCPSPCISGGLGTGQTVSMNRLLFGDPLLGSVSRNTNPLGKNQYDALLAKVEHRFSSGFSLVGSFTFSKLYEDTSILGPEIAGALVEHKLGGEDRPMRLSVASVWELPLGRGKRFGSTMPRAVNAVVGGWELTALYTIQSGVPLVFGNDSFFTGKDPKLPSDQRTLERWFDTSQFRPFPGKNTDITNYPSWTGIQNLPGYGYKPTQAEKNGGLQNGVYQDFATFVRRYPTRWSDVRAPGVNEVNLGVYKNFHVTERVKLQFRFDAFNAFNHARYPGPNTDPGSTRFGQITQQQENAPRQIELAGKLTF